MNNNYKKIKNLVYNYKTKYPEGFLQSEQDDLKSKFKGINIEKYNNALEGCTCMYNEEDGLIIYHCDVLRALQCAIENRELKSWEWD